MIHLRGCGCVLGISSWLEWVGRWRWGWSDGSSSLGNEAVSLVVADWRSQYLFPEARRGCMSRVCGSAANDSGLLMKSDSADVSVGGAVQPGWFSLHLHMLHVSGVSRCSITVVRLWTEDPGASLRKCADLCDLPQTWAAFKVIL